MLDIKPPDYKYCPFCGNALVQKVIHEEKRKYCPKDDWAYYPHVSQAAAAVIEKENKILMVKRKRIPYKNTWMFPAGFVDFGEHPKETVVREVKEETELTVKSTELMEVLQSEDDPRDPGHLIFFYKVKATGEIKNKDKEENIDIGWFEIKNPPKIGWKQHREIIKLLQEEKS